MKTMRAARLHAFGEPFRVESIAVPEPGAHDVRIRVTASGVVPNLRNIVTTFNQRNPALPVRQLPAVYGLDAVGTVEALGSEVSGLRTGDRVYVNPALTCGACLACRGGVPTHCPDFTFLGYFGFGANSNRIYQHYCSGGFAEYLTAPASNLVSLPDAVSDEAGARFGYLGTAYSALRKANVGPGSTVLIDGISGTLGVNAAMLALAMGASRIFGTGRNAALLDAVQRLSPDRIVPLRLGHDPIPETVRDGTAGVGVDAAIGALGPGAPASSAVDGLLSLRRGGISVGCGGLGAPIPMEPLLMMRRELQYRGSLWFTTGEAQQMASLASAGLLDLSVLQHQRFALEDINRALDAVDGRHGGFTNIVITPQCSSPT